MKIAVLGAGNTGCALAADYSLRGHDVTLIKTSHSMHDDNFNYLCENKTIEVDEFGEKRIAHLSAVTRDLSCVSSAQLVLLCTQTGYHREVLNRVAPYLRNGQVLMIVPGYLSTAYVLRSGADAGVICVECESSFIDGRISAPGHFKVGFRNVRNPVGVYPCSAIHEARAVLDALGTPFTYLSSVAEAALHNPNMIVHTVGAVMSIPRIEATRGDYCMYHEVFTPSVWNILEQLDGEKITILKKLGFDGTSYVEACKYRNSLDEGEDAKDVFYRYAAMPTRAKGPVNVESRYITEDVSQGIAMLESLGKVLDVPTPIATALIDISSAALGRDMREGGRTVEALSLDVIQRILADHQKG